MPAAEYEVTADLVRRLLAAQHPDLAGLPVTPFTNGWDNTLFRLGDGLVVRLPRRALGAVIAGQRAALAALARAAAAAARPCPGAYRGDRGRGTRGRGASWSSCRGHPPRTGRRSIRGGRRRTSAASSARCTCRRRRMPRPTPTAGCRSTAAARHNVAKNLAALDPVACRRGRPGRGACRLGRRTRGSRSGTVPPCGCTATRTRPTSS